MSQVLFFHSTPLEIEHSLHGCLLNGRFTFSRSFLRFGGFTATFLFFIFHSEHWVQSKLLSSIFGVAVALPLSLCLGGFPLDGEVLGGHRLGLPTDHLTVAVGRHLCVVLVPTAWALLRWLRRSLLLLPGWGLRHLALLGREFLRSSNSSSRGAELVAS